MSTNTKDFFSGAKSYKVGHYTKNASGIRTFQLYPGVVLRSEAIEGADGKLMTKTIVSVNGIEREANGLFINLIDREIAMAEENDFGAEKIQKLVEKKSKGVTSFLSARLK